MEFLNSTNHFLTTQSSADRISKRFANSNYYVVPIYYLFYLSMWVKQLSNERTVVGGGRPNTADIRSDLSCSWDS